MQKLFVTKEPGAVKRADIKKPSLFSRAAVLLAALVTTSCGKPTDEPQDRRNDGGGIISNDEGTNHDKTVNDGGMVVLPEPEPCVTSDRSHTFTWAYFRPEELEFVGYNNAVFPSAPIKMIWIMDIDEHAADRSFYTEGIHNDIVHDRKLVRLGFRLKLSDYPNSERYAIAFLCANEQGLGVATNLLGRIMSVNGEFTETDFALFLNQEQVGAAEFNACRSGGGSDGVPARERLVSDQTTIREAGISDGQPTPIFILFNPENNRCRSIVGAASTEDFELIVRYLGVDPDNWPPPAP